MNIQRPKSNLLSVLAVISILALGVGCKGFFVNPTLSTLTVGPTTPTIQQGNTLQLAATGTYSDGSTKSLTGNVLWTSSDPSVVSVSSTGLVTAVSVGSPVTITAASGTVSNNTTVTVTLGNIVSIAVTPQTSTINHGSNPSFTAKATLSDGTVHDITSSAIWSSSNTSAGTIDSTGLFTSATTGTFPQTTTITAGSGGTNVVGTATLTVN